VAATPALEEGWYLMSTQDLEIELEQWRSPDKVLPPSQAQKLSIEEALAYRNAGNLPDSHGRTLRLVLTLDMPEDLNALQSRRLGYEPDFHAAPRWRRPGSSPVNVVPLRRPEVRGEARPWWEEPELAALEDEWSSTGAVAGLHIPSEYRSFVYKTILALRAADLEVSPDSVADSIARWVPSQEAQEIRDALGEANRR
jgi:hypothetical protein